MIGNTSPGAFSVRAVRPVQVATAAQLEQRTADGSWVQVHSSPGAAGYLLSETCSPIPPSPCRSLSAGETLVPVPWSGDECGVQCGKPCEPEARFLSGVHRLVVTDCLPPHERYEGPPFEMPSSARALARLRITDVEQVRAARLEEKGFRLTAGVTEPGRIAGLKEISGTSRELSAELLAELMAWLHAESGFNDRVMKRCPPGITVGFVLTHKGRGGTAPRTDLDVDLGCSALDIVQNGEQISFAYFDPSRERLFSILRRVFPNDPQLKREIDRQLAALATRER
ncbi:MAG TPA: hypothetical protein VFK05_29335 [Polyangiaceae bacterium]|nr:hypothetical protein [Polyangiaceae bacterium]